MVTISSPPFFDRLVCQVAHEFNLYCEGKHPLFPVHTLLDGSTPGLPDRRLHLPLNSGAFIRSSEGSQGTSLAMVCPSTMQIIQHRGFRDIYLEVITRRSSLGTTLGLRDDYHWWCQDYSSDIRGKLLPLLLDDHDVHQVFLDDYIEENRGAIVDARSVEDGEPLDFYQVRGDHLLRVDTVQAVIDNQYYIKVFERYIKPNLGQVPISGPMDF